MEVVLLEQIANLGSLGETVKVKSGYGRNFLIPYGKAVLATKKNIKDFKEYRSKIEAKLADIKLNAQLRADNISKLGSITISSRASKDGKLFGSITSRQIANAITDAGINISKKDVRLHDGALRTIGEHKVHIQIDADISAIISICIVTAN